MARPKKDIKGLNVQRLASYGLNNTEIAEYFDVDEGTIRKSFSEFLAKGRNSVKTKLRRAQIKVALSGNPIMLIWLGKNMLGQSDKLEENKEFGITITRSKVSFADLKDDEDRD